jgi:hypothetical protein
LPTKKFGVLHVAYLPGYFSFSVPLKKWKEQKYVSFYEFLFLKATKDELSYNTQPHTQQLNRITAWK